MPHPLNVLILEDRREDAEMVARALEQADFAVHWRRVDTEQDYLDGLRQNPDVILSDHSLPQYDSVRALRALKSTDLDIPFVIVSGTINEELAVALMKEGASDYLIKDRLTRLGPAVAQALQQRRLRQQRLQAEHALRASEARFKALIENCADAIVLLDVTGALLYCSRAAERITGYSAEELIGRTALDFLQASDAPRFKTLFTKLIAATSAEPVPFLVHSHRRDGSWIWLEGTLTNLVAEPKVGAIVCNCRDVTAYHEAEISVRQSEQRLRLALEAARLGRWDWSAETDLIVWLPSQEDDTETTGDVLQGSLTKFTERVYPEDLPELVAAVTQAAYSGSAFQHEVRVYWPDGSIRWIAGRGQFTHKKSGRPIRMTGVFMDVSERKATEERLRKSLAEKEVLLREVHHRVKNNLQVICSLLQLQGQYASGVDTGELLRESQNRVRSMALVHEKLYRAGDLSQIDFAEYLRSLSTSLFHTYETARRVRLTFDLDVAPLTLDAAIPCGLVVNELLSNALKHAFPDGRTGEVRVSLHALEDGQVSLAVSDNGVGLSKDFDAANSPTFGFRLITTLVAQLHGSLEFHSDHGAEARIVLPAQKRPHGRTLVNGPHRVQGVVESRGDRRSSLDAKNAAGPPDSQNSP